ncbi:MAG: response regulator [Nitrospinae bacterium]|nr:response regulator [Nitrospinota bacterium]
MAGEAILIVDDNPANLKLVRVLLTTEGYDVRTASNAENALAVLETFRPRLILMDLQLSGADGLELTRQLKADPATRNIIIVALTAYAMKGDEQRALDAGCDGYIAKPIDTRTLPDVLAGYLARTRSSAGEQGPKTPSILIVEDNSTTRKMMRVTLEVGGYTVVEAADARTALEQMQKHVPDLVLQDLLLPDMDGFDLVAKIRALPGSAELPIIALSGFLPKLEEAQSLQVGFTGFLFKPVEPSRLLQTIQAYLPGMSTAPARPSQGRRILVAEDDPIQRKLLSFCLSQVGFQVITAEDGADALEQARRSPPDAIVSDVLMPRLDGVELCLAVRQDPQLMHIPVVLLSAAYLEDGDRLALDVGATAFVHRMPGFQSLIEALLGIVNEETRPPAARPLKLPEMEYNHRVIRQLERQVAMNTGLAQAAAVQTAQLSILTSASEILTKAPDVEKVLDEVLVCCLNASAFSMGAVYLAEPDGGLSLRVHLGYPASIASALAGFFGHADLLKHAMEEGELMGVPSSHIPEDRAGDLLRRAGAKSMLIMPLGIDDERLGVVVMGSTHKELEAEWVTFGKAVSSQISQAILLSHTVSRLASAAQRLSDLIQGLDAIIWEADETTSRFSFVSQQAEEILGYPVERWLTEPDFLANHIHPDDREPIMARYRSVIAEGRDHELEYRMVKADGGVVRVRDRVRVVRDAEGQVRQVRGLMVDSTPRG